MLPGEFTQTLQIAPGGDPDATGAHYRFDNHRGDIFCAVQQYHLLQFIGQFSPLFRLAAAELAAFLRDDVPGFETAYMSMLSPTVGVRETRKLQGMYCLRGADLANATKFSDGIVACDNPVDDVMRAKGGMTHDAALEAGAFYTIPFRSLVPQKIENLMFAGRILSADPTAFASVRGMPQCMAMGQAVGTAAALALHNECSVQSVDHDVLVASLTDQGINRIGGSATQQHSVA